MASHTWHFYVHLGRTKNQSPVSGAIIVGYSSKTGSATLVTLTTNSSGYATHTISGSSINPTGYYWRAYMPDSSSLKEYHGQYLFGIGSTSSNYYGTPTASFNSEGAAVTASNFNGMNPNGSYSVTTHLHVVLNTIYPNISSAKFVTRGELVAVIPPGQTMWKSDLNRCVTHGDVFSYTSSGTRQYFSSGGVSGSNTRLMNRNFVTPYIGFISGSATVSFSQPSAMTWYNGSNTYQSQTITLTNAGSNFSLKCTLGSSTYFSVSYPSTTSGNNKVYTVTVTPKSTNTTSQTRSTTLRFSIIFPDAQESDATKYYYAGDANVGTTVSLYQYGNGSGSGGGGTSTTSLASIGEFDEI